MHTACRTTRQPGEYLQEYYDWMVAMMEEIFPSEFYKHNHFVSLFCLVIQFHYNRWNRAMIAGDLSLLVDALDNKWMAYRTVILFELTKLDADIFRTHLRLYGVFCTRCGSLAMIATACGHKHCGTAKAQTAATLPASYKFPVSEKVFKEKFSEWKEAKVKAGDKKKNYSYKDFTNEKGYYIEGARPKAVGSSMPVQLHQSQHLLPHFEYGKKKGYVMRSTGAY